MTVLISSQRYLDDDIVAAKLAEQDFEVLVSPVFEIGGVQYRVVLDGHHSLEAARIAGVTPDYVIATLAQNDTISWLRDGEVDMFLQINRIDSDFYDVSTGLDVW